MVSYFECFNKWSFEDEGRNEEKEWKSKRAGVGGVVRGWDPWPHIYTYLHSYSQKNILWTVTYRCVCILHFPVTGVDLWGCVVGIGVVVAFYTTLVSRNHYEASCLVVALITPYRIIQWNALLEKDETFHWITRCDASVLRLGNSIALLERNWVNTVQGLLRIVVLDPPIHT